MGRTSEIHRERTMIPRRRMSLPGLAALIGRPWFWATVIGVLFGVPLGRGLTQRNPPPAPPLLGPFPSFALASDGGGEFKDLDLHRRPFVAGLLCSDCAEAAERLATMRTLQHRTRNLGDAVRLVSFSQRLDAAALREVRGKNAGGQRWILLAGAPVAAARLFPGANTLVLVDGDLRIRGR